jgi:hypothetical protein
LVAAPLGTILQPPFQLLIAVMTLRVQLKDPIVINDGYPG